MDAAAVIARQAGLRLHAYGSDPALSAALVWNWLSAEERSRAMRFRFGRDRSRYVERHGFLRRELAMRLAAPPSAIEFAVGRYGQPRAMIGDRPGPAFSLSHSGGYCGLLIGGRSRVGLDLQLQDDLPDLHRVAEQVLCAREQARCAARGGAQRVAEFFRCWTFKEALGKALGLGLDPAVVATATPAVAGEFDAFATRWTVSWLCPADRYVACSVCETSSRDP